MSRWKLYWLLGLLMGAAAWPQLTEAQFAIRGRIASRGLVQRSGDAVGGADAKPTLVEYDDHGRKFALCSGGFGPRCGEIATLPGVKLGTPTAACAAAEHRDECMRLYGAYRSVAYSGNQVLYASSRLIAYETDFFTIDPKEEAAAGRSNCVLDEDRLPLGTNVDKARALNFVRCSTPSMNVHGESRVWAPVKRAHVEIVNYNIYRSTETNELGYFEIPYRARVNEYAAFDINAVVTFGGFEPRVRSAKKFYLSASAVSGYVFEPSQTFISALPISGYLTDPAGSSGTVYANIPLEAAVLNVRLELVNRVVTKDKDGHDVLVLDEPVGLTGYQPGVTRYAHAAQGTPIGQHQGRQIGLLQEISTPDLRDTEIYVYRVADGKLIGSRWGMSDTEVASSDCLGHACLTASMLMRGPASLYTAHSPARFNPAANVPPLVGADGKIVTPGRFGIELDYAHGLNGGHSPFLRTGDQAKVIAINRATGYMGSALVKMRQTAAGTMEFVSADPETLDSNFLTVKLAPPNIKVIATREVETQHGATRGVAKNRRPTTHAQRGFHRSPCAGWSELLSQPSLLCDVHRPRRGHRRLRGGPDRYIGLDMHDTRGHAGRSGRGSVVTATAQLRAVSHAEVQRRRHEGGQENSRWQDRAAELRLAVQAGDAVHGVLAEDGGREPHKQRPEPAQRTRCNNTHGLVQRRLAATHALSLEGADDIVTHRHRRRTATAQARAWWSIRRCHPLERLRHGGRVS
jgi:hypothetical protein